MKDQILGGLILVVSIAAAVFYIWWIFLAPEPWRTWALITPVLIAVLAVLGIIGWIGYTMATTPPPAPIEEFEVGEESGAKQEAKEEQVEKES